MRLLFLFVLLSVATLGQAEEEAGLKPRLVVCTDIAPADVEPDDNESMVRLLAYADLFEIEALIASVGWNCDPYPKEWFEYLQRAIEAYRQAAGKADIQEEAYRLNLKKLEQGLVSQLEFRAINDALLKSKADLMNSLFKLLIKQSVVRYYEGVDYIDQN
jgi:hypothetical protein